MHKLGIAIVIPALQGRPPLERNVQEGVRADDVAVEVPGRERGVDG